MDGGVGIVAFVGRDDTSFAGLGGTDLFPLRRGIITLRGYKKNILKKGL